MRRSIATTATPIGVAILVIAAGMFGGAPDVSAFGSGIHERITENALPFLTGNTLSTIVAGNLDEDEGAASDLAERHAQNCRFRDSAAYVNMRYEQVIDALRSPRSNDPNRAPRLFGHILHGVQDFYSHSNWIPMPPQGLGIRDRILDAGLGKWTLYAVIHRAARTTGSQITPSRQEMRRDKSMVSPSLALDWLVTWSPTTTEITDMLRRILSGTTRGAGDWICHIRMGGRAGVRQLWSVGLTSGEVDGQDRS